MQRYNNRYNKKESRRSIGQVVRSPAYSRLKQEIEDDFISLINRNTEDNDRILDYCGGIGKASRNFFNKYPQVDIEPIIIDISHTELRRAGSMEYGEKFELIAGDGERLPFSAGSFDAVIARNAFHHLPDWHRSGLDEIRRVLKDDGILVFKDPLQYNPLAWTFRKLFESREKTDAEVPLNPLLLRDRLERVFDEVSLIGSYFISPVFGVMDKHIPIPMTPVIMNVHKLERYFSSHGGFALAGGVIGIAQNPRNYCIKND